MNHTLNLTVDPLLKSFACGGPHQTDSEKEYVYRLTGEFKGTMIFLAILNFFVCLPTFLLNLLIIVGFTSNSGLRTVSNRLLLSICAADLLVGLLLEPIMGTHVLTIAEGNHKCGLSNFLVFTVPVLIVVTMVTHAGIAVERYAAVHYQQFHQRYFTKRHTTIFMIVVWVFCPWSFFIPFLAGHPVLGTRIAGGLILLSLAFSLYCYISIYRDSSWRHGKPKYEMRGAYIVRHPVEQHENIEDMSVFRQDVRLALFYFKLYACMLAFYLLNLIKNIINSYETLDGNAHHIFHYFLDSLLFINAFVNPILILWFSTEILRAVSRIFKN